MYGTLAEKIFFRLSNKFLRLFSPDWANKRAIKWVSARYDMCNEENEKFFAHLYLYHIRRNINEIFGDHKLHILDAGCGQGRISIPLALDGHLVTAMDFTNKAIEVAEKNAYEKHTNIKFILGDLEKDLKILSPNKFDCVISTEVLYMVKNYEKVIKDLVSLLIPGGVIFVSLRPRMFYVLHNLARGNTKDAYSIMMNKEKYVSGGSLNCLSVEEIQQVLEDTGIKIINVVGIGVLSGIEGDPQSNFTTPSSLSEEEKANLFEMELMAGMMYPENGRYILVSGVKNK